MPQGCTSSNALHRLTLYAVSRNALGSLSPAAHTQCIALVRLPCRPHGPHRAYVPEADSDTVELGDGVGARRQAVHPAPSDDSESGPSRVKPFTTPCMYSPLK
jgi:hypothetical protein